MARRTAIEEASRLIDQFFKETMQDYKDEMAKTQQPHRVLGLHAEVQALDKAQGKFYAWKTSRGKA
jgi:hypothetical protein